MPSSIVTAAGSARSVAVLLAVLLLPTMSVSMAGSSSENPGRLTTSSRMAAARRVTWWGMHEPASPLLFCISNRVLPSSRRVPRTLWEVAIGGQTAW